jgi:prepilin-type N-terminal cleavage/methylation domain-containing protein
MTDKTQKTKSYDSGFTLVELMVAVSIFTIVMVISMGSIMSVIDANKKSQTLRAVMDNLNFSMESMTRDIRFGENYHCGITDPPSLTLPYDCAAGDSVLNFRSADGPQVVYKLVGNRVVKTVTIASVPTDFYVTSPDVVIQDLTFRVYGSPPYFSSNNLSQAKVVLIIRGYAGVKETTKSSFILETTISQRKLDL